MMKAALNKTLRKLGNIATLQRRVHALAVMERERYVKDLLMSPRYESELSVTRRGFKVYSQYDEDGIIQEIFSRIGMTSRRFVEFGVEEGLENNTLKLLLEGWEGLWLEASSAYVNQMRRTFDNVIQAGRLRIKQAFVDRDNINNLIGEFYEGEIDLLSIDIDGNDIHVFDAIRIIQPRVVVIEYNGKFPPPLSIAQAYNPGHRWRATDYGGASLSAIAKVAEAKNYKLVGCNITGVNAFLVRGDLVNGRFLAPYTAEQHYEPARYFLWGTFVSGHPPDWGDYVAI